MSAFFREFLGLTTRMNSSRYSGRQKNRAVDTHIGQLLPVSFLAD